MPKNVWRSICVVGLEINVGGCRYSKNVRERNGMNKYVCLCRGVSEVVFADTSYQAQQKALPIFQRKAGRRKVKSSEIFVMVAEIGGKEVVHIADF